jgi:hypothetical protein
MKHLKGGASYKTLGTCGVKNLNCGIQSREQSHWCVTRNFVCCYLIWYPHRMLAFKMYETRFTELRCVGISTPN